MSNTTVSIDALGLCERCGALLSLEGIPADAMDSRWHCTSPTCKAELTHRSFGYDKSEQGAKKVKWVGPESTWVTERPTEDFQIGTLYVTTSTPYR